MLFYFKLSWIDKIQMMIESIIAQLQNIIYIEEAGIKVWWFFYIIQSQEMNINYTRFDQITIMQCIYANYIRSVLVSDQACCVNQYHDESR